MPLTFSGNEGHINLSKPNAKTVGLEGPSKYANELKEVYHKSKGRSSGPGKSEGSIMSETVGRTCRLDLDAEEMRKPKHVIISDEVDEDGNMETTALRRQSENSDSLADNSLVSDSYLTLSGTIKRGKKKGQNVEVILNMSREELEVIEANLADDEKKTFKCRDGAKNGVHVLVWSLLCMPLSFVLSTLYSFYMGTITWYNVFSLYSERRPLGYRLVFPPVLVVAYPFYIVICSVGLGVFAGARQVSWRWDSWWKEFADLEKGFFAWLCSVLDLSECSPYEVVVLSGIQKP